MLPFVESLVRQITLTTLLDIGITALFIYGLFSLIRGTRAVTLVIGVTILLADLRPGPVPPAPAVHPAAPGGRGRRPVRARRGVPAGAPAGARADRPGGVAELALRRPSSAAIEHVAAEVSKAAGILSREGHGALIVLERETGLEEIAESGVMLHSSLSHELLTTIFAPRTELHDGAVIIRGDGILAAAALLPLTEMSLSERFGTRHRAALGITEDTDAVAVVVSEESGQMSVVERARIVRVPTEAQLERALVALLESPSAPGAPPPGLGHALGAPPDPAGQPATRGRHAGSSPGARGPAGRRAAGPGRHRRPRRPRCRRARGHRTRPARDAAGR